MQTDLESATARTAAYEEVTGDLRQELAGIKATSAALEQRLAEREREISALQARLERSHEEHRAEQDKLTERTQLAEHRYADMEKRALREIDRERVQSARLQKSLETERAMSVSERERLQSEQNQTQVAISQLHQEIGSLQNAVDMSRREREREQADAHAMRLQLEDAIRQCAVESASAERLRQELSEMKLALTKAADSSRSAKYRQRRRKPRP